jgi:hypothetical protein
MPSHYTCLSMEFFFIKTLIKFMLSLNDTYFEQLNVLNLINVNMRRKRKLFKFSFYDLSTLLPSMHVYQTASSSYFTTEDL